MHELVMETAAGVESRSAFHNWYNVFAFGDSFADTGNLPQDMGELSRAWFLPYGTSFQESNGRPNSNPAGRFSDYMVQSDFLAKILGLHEGPHAYKNSFLHLPRYGMVFATGGAGVFEVPQKVETLSKQDDEFEKLVEEGAISRSCLLDAVMLVAISGNDNLPSNHLMSNSSNVTAFIGNVTTEIVANVKRLQKLGGIKILVNNMHSIGCMPRNARASNYTNSKKGSNKIASIHNKNLERKLGANNNVLILDLNTAFTNIINSSTDSPVSEQFTYKLTPCCEATDPKGYCGLQSKTSELQFKVDARNEGKHFYWDDMQPHACGLEGRHEAAREAHQEFLDQD